MDLIGKTLGQYHIVEAIGHGGMASVFKARQPALDRDVAVKVLLPHQASTPEFRERFTREAKAITQLNHASGDRRPVDRSGADRAIGRGRTLE